MVYEYVTKEILEQELQTYVDRVESSGTDWEYFFDWQDTDVVAFSIDNESNLISQIVVKPKAKDIENLYEHVANFEYEKIIITDYEHFEKEYACCQSSDTYCDGYYGDYGFCSGNGKSIFWNQKAKDEQLKELKNSVIK